jgi:hypothetical protein
MTEPVIPWLLVVFRPELTLAWIPADIGPGFTLADELFEQVGDDDLSGFYDRLYAPDGVMVGVQVTPIVMPDLAKELSALPYVRSVSDGKQLRIMFEHIAPKTELREEIDQAFGGRMYRSLGNDVAMSFDTFFLDETERQYLASRPARWVTVTPIEQ